MSICRRCRTERLIACKLVESPMKQHTWMTFLLAALAGAAIWALTPVLTNHREPWDTEGSFYLVALGIAGAVAGAIKPTPLWAHYVGSFAGQLGYELIFLRVGPLVVIGAFFLLIYCAVYSIAAGLAALVRGRILKRYAQSSLSTHKRM